jgi:hypothetical protein
MLMKLQNQAFLFIFSIDEFINTYAHTHVNAYILFMYQTKDTAFSCAEPSNDFPSTRLRKIDDIEKGYFSMTDTICSLFGFWRNPLSHTSFDLDHKSRKVAARFVQFHRPKNSSLDFIDRQLCWVFNAAHRLGASFSSIRG